MRDLPEPQFRTSFIVLIIGDPVLSMLWCGVALILQSNCILHCIIFHCHQTHPQHPLPSSVGSCDYRGHSHHTNDIVSSLRCSFFSVLLFHKLLIVKGVREELIGCPSFLQKHFFSWHQQQNQFLNKQFLTLHVVKYKTLTHDSYIYIQLHPFLFVCLKLGIWLRYSWLSIPLRGMQTHMGLNDSIFVKYCFF